MCPKFMRNQLGGIFNQEYGLQDGRIRVHGRLVATLHYRNFAKPRCGPAFVNSSLSQFLLDRQHRRLAAVL